MVAALNYPLVKLFNRVLSDYPMAREQLARHTGKVIAASIGPIESRLRVTADGAVEMVGEGGDIQPDVAFQIPLSLLPRLARRDDAAFREVTFTGDSEFVALLFTLARELEWDVEEDLGKLVGDIAAHRIVGTIKCTRALRVEAGERFIENVAEYLTEERQAFIRQADLESLAHANETLRDDVARLEARLGKLAANADSR